MNEFKINTQVFGNITNLELKGNLYTKNEPILKQKIDSIDDEDFIIIDLSEITDITAAMIYILLGYQDEYTNLAFVHPREENVINALEDTNVQNMLRIYFTIANAANSLGAFKS